jgi:hypothetical protein
VVPQQIKLGHYPDEVAVDCARQEGGVFETEEQIGVPANNALHRTTFVLGFAGEHAAGKCERYVDLELRV